MDCRERQCPVGPTIITAARKREQIQGFTSSVVNDGGLIWMQLFSPLFLRSQVLFEFMFSSDATDTTAALIHKQKSETSLLASVLWHSVAADPSWTWPNLSGR